MRRFMTVTIGLLLLSGCGRDFPALPAPPAAPAQTAPAAAPEPAPAPEPTAATASAAATEMAAAPAPMATEPMKSSAGSYVVVRGDTLSGIAEARGLNPDDLAAWNRIDDPRKLQIGTELRLSAPGN